MSIAAKHAYRFGYLKSEQWKNVRAAVLARDGAKCLVCGQEDISNDIHHCRYPESVWDTKPEDCITLCRFCHDKMHDLMKNKITWGEIVRLTLMKMLLKWYVDLNKGRVHLKRRQARRMNPDWCRVCGSNEVNTSPRQPVDTDDVLLSICDRCWSDVVNLPSPRTWSAFSKLRKKIQLTMPP